MNLSKPLTSLVPSLEGEVLTVLAGAEVAFTGLQVQKVIGNKSVSGVAKTLAKLTAQGIVVMKTAGMANLYQLNREHLLARYILGVANVREEFFESIRSEIENWEIEPNCVAIFGSAARLDMTPESDIDIFISRPDGIEFRHSPWRAQLTQFSLKISSWTGNSINLFEVGPADLNPEFRDQNGVLKSIISQGVIVYGPKNYLTKFRTKFESQQWQEL